MSPGGDQKRVLITGAAGRIGSSLVEHLKDRYRLRVHYHRTIPEQPPVADQVIADVSVYEQIAPALEGMDAVVHMAGDPSTRASWENVRARNIDGTYNVLEAARRAGCKKVVLASTNHVMGMYDRDQQWPVYGHQPVRPDSLYGVSKAFGEALGRHYHDQFGLSVICLRIGWFLPQPRDEIEPLDVALPPRLRPGHLAGDRERPRLRCLLRHLPQRRAPLGHHGHHGAAGLPPRGRRRGPRRRAGRLPVSAQDPAAEGASRLRVQP